MLDKIAEMIAEQLHVSPGTIITEDTNFKQDLRADSFELMELVMALEEEYGIKVDDEDLETFETVGDVMNYIKNQGIDEE
ncbi:MAG TPA: acyl carrier protein [Lachnospiraceae bacterium]|nr:acyl carrier protein [Lachnospiraceae bacterium]HPF29579.1 acyl carrier protein [Lachnospiraceae bacterium]